MLVSKVSKMSRSRSSASRSRTQNQRSRSRLVSRENFGRSRSRSHLVYILGVTNVCLTCTVFYSVQTSGIARNFLQGVRQSVAFLPSHPIAAQPPYQVGHTVQSNKLSQRDRAADSVSFGWLVGDGVGQTILCTKPYRYQ